MILSTMNDLPGYEVTEVIGGVFGLTVGRGTSAPSSGPGSRSLVGGD